MITSTTIVIAAIILLIAFIIGAKACSNNFKDIKSHEEIEEEVRKRFNAQFS